MSRVINPNAVGKKRNQLVKAVAISLRELAQLATTDNHARDVAAFVVLALESISKTIDPSVQAWEKRGYWVKADRFRMDWLWTGQYGKELRRALLSEDWAQVAVVISKIGEKLGDIKVPVRHRLGRPWVGAWNKMIEE
jgi:hypothetical protein